MKEHHVGIAQMQISADPDTVLVAPNLGSCVGVAVYDSRRQVGAMIHCLLPLSKADPEKAKENPFMYVDSGVAAMFDELFRQGCERQHLRIVAAGGANINDENNVFEIGKRNFTVLKKILWKNNLLLKGESFGDSFGRTLKLDIGSGKTWLKAQGESREL